MSETTTEGTAQARTFWPTDYQRFASIIRDVRKNAGDEAADALREVTVSMFSADSGQFDVDRFTKMTGPPMPAHVAALARALKQTRHVRCQPYTGKPAEHQEKVDAFAHILTGALGDVPGFDPDTFVTSTKLPEPQQAFGGYDEPDDDPDDD